MMTSIMNKTNKYMPIATHVSHVENKRISDQRQTSLHQTLANIAVVGEMKRLDVNHFMFLEQLP